MFGWLEKKAAQQSIFNIGINTKTLILISNRADEAIEQSGKDNPANTKDIVSAQKALLTDIELALANKATLSEVLNKIEEVKLDYTVSQGAELAIKHVLSYVKK